MDISVIVPVYKVEPVFERCLRSLFGQSKTDGVEFIFINDCTPDGSMAVLERVMTDYPNLTINIINHPENRGVAATRQTGLDAAIGEYTIQIDSDDWCEPTMLEDLYNKAMQNDADIVVCDICHNNCDKIESFASTYNSINLFKSIYKWSIFGGSVVWNKLIKRSLYTENRVDLNCGINYGEDFLFIARIYCYSQKIAYINMAYIHYMYNENSMMNNHYEKRVSDYVIMYDRLYQFMIDSGFIQRYREDIVSLVLHNKEILVRASDKEIQRRYANICPMTNKYILGEKNIKIIRRLALCFAAHNMLFVSNMIYSLARCVKKLKLTKC